MHPLVNLTPNRPTGTPQIGDLVTVVLHNDVRSGARLVRVFGDNVFVRLCGLTVPAPYRIGDVLPLERSAVVDW